MKILEKIKGLHVLTDRELAYPRSLLKIIKLSILGGACVIQLRDKNASFEEMVSLGKNLQVLLKGKNIPLIVNDNFEVALALKASGIHVGQKDTSAKEIRKLINKKMILGVSVSTVEEAIKAQQDGADYVGAGPVFFTSTKQDCDPAINLEGLRAIKRSINIPVVAIGGITLENAPDVAKIADGIAVISAVINSNNPKKITMEFTKIIKKYRS